MSTRAEAYVAQFEAVTADFVSTISGCTDEQWRRQTASEGWTVAAVAHHLVEVYATFAGVFERLAAGTADTPALTSEMVDANNANHARSHAAAEKSETLALLQQNAAAVVHAMRDLSDERFDDTVFLFDGGPLSAAQVMELALIAHANEHLASIRKTIVA